MLLLQVSVLLEALFASLLKDENKDLKKKKEKALRSKSENKSPEDRDDIIKVGEEDEEEEIVKVIVSLVVVLDDLCFLYLYVFEVLLAFLMS